jgi:hypothetical protein
MHDLLIRETKHGHSEMLTSRLMLHNNFCVGFLYSICAVKNAVDKFCYVRERTVNRGDKFGDLPMRAPGELFARAQKYS